MTHSPTQQGIVPPVRYRFSFAIETARNLRKTNPALFYILAFTVVTRIVIYTTGQPWNEDVIANTILDGDGLQYHEIAVGFLNGTPLSETNWHTDKTLGYPYFVTAIYAISNNSIWLVFAIQTLMNIAMVPMIYWVARRIFASNTVGLFAAGFYAISAIPAAWATRYLYTEALFTFVMMIFLIVLIQAWKKDSFKWFLLLGVLLGIGANVRSVLQFFVIIPLVIIALQDRPVRNKLLISSAIIIGTMAAMAPGQIRNFKEYGHYSLSTISGNVLFKHTVQAKANAEGTDYFEARDNIGWQQWVDYENPFDRSAAAKKVGIKYVTNNPKEFVILWVQGMTSFLIGTEKSSYLYVIFDQERPVIDLPNGYETFSQRIIRNLKSTQKEYFLLPLFGIKFLFEYVAIALGLLLLIRRDQKLLALFFVLGILYFIVATGPMGRAPRYKIPVIPIYAILGGGGLTMIWAYWNSWRNPGSHLPE